MLVTGAWNRVDAGVVRDASALLRARPGSLATYFPEGTDARSLAKDYELGYTDAHALLRTQLSDDLTAMATSFHDAATILRGQPGFGALADSIDGAAAVVTEGVSRVPTNQIHAFAGTLQDTLNRGSRIAASLEVIAARGLMPSDQATTRGRIIELTARPFGRQSMEQLHELAVLADDLPPELAIERRTREPWEMALREYFDVTTDPERAPALRAVQVARVAELHAHAKHPTLHDALARIDHLIAGDRTLSLDTVELYGLLRHDDVRNGIELPSQIPDRIGHAIRFIDEPATAMDQARVDHHVGMLRTLRLATTREQALEVAHDAL